MLMIYLIFILLINLIFIFSFSHQYLFRLFFCKHLIEVEPNNFYTSKEMVSRIHNLPNGTGEANEPILIC